MKTLFKIFTVIGLAALPLAAQQKHPDLNGVWEGPYTPDLSRTLGRGETIPFTRYGADRFKKVDPANNPDGFCLPVGPARGFQSPAPFQLVQNGDTIAVLFENQRIFRIIYSDGTKHPDDIAEYPEWMGHSIAHWEGDKLVVDTVGLNDRTWLDTAGHEHSDKLHLIETFEKTSADNIHYTVTFEDPVFFSKPWTSNREFKRQNTRIMSYSCEENEKDRTHLQPKK
jgi:hypothetical protein